MDTIKLKRVYLGINIPMMISFILLLIAPFFVSDKGNAVYYIGITARIIMGVWMIFNGIWSACTNYYSIFHLHENQDKIQSHKWVWWILVILGIGCIITAFLGYGFNNVTKVT